MGKWTPTVFYFDGQRRDDLKDDLQRSIINILENGPANTWGIAFTLDISIDLSSDLLMNLQEYDYIYQEHTGLWFTKDWKRLIRDNCCLTCGKPMGYVKFPITENKSMTGFLESLNEQVAKLTADVAAIKQHLNGAIAAPAATLPVVAAQPVATADPLAGINPTAQTPAAVAATVTDEMVMKLVTDNVANEQIKAGMQQVLAQMGIARLPDTRPDQLPELYQRLSAIVAQYAGATAAVAATPALPAAAAPASIL